MEFLPRAIIEDKGIVEVAELLGQGLHLVYMFSFFWISKVHVNKPMLVHQILQLLNMLDEVRAGSCHPLCPLRDELWFVFSWPRDLLSLEPN